MKDKTAVLLIVGVFIASFIVGYFAFGVIVGEFETYRELYGDGPIPVLDEEFTIPRLFVIVVVFGIILLILYVACKPPKLSDGKEER